VRIAAIVRDLGREVATVDDVRARFAAQLVPA
jgi:hypothetical protein